MNWFPVFQDASLPLTYIPAILLGVAFGFVLERSGFGRAPMLAAQFYGHNMRVFKVMFTAILTAAAGIALLSGVGMLDASLIYTPPTFLWPHLVGGLLLGAGFIVSGYCPGTSIVAAASSKLDGVVTVLGVVIGSVLFGEVYPLIKTFYTSGSLGVKTLTDVTGISYGWLTAMIIVGAVLCFVFAEKAEVFFSKIFKQEIPERMNAGNRGLFAGLLVGASIGAFVFMNAPTPAKKQPATARVFKQITPTKLAKMLIEKPRKLYLVDLRNDTECRQKTRTKRPIARAICLKDIKKLLGQIYAKKTLVLYDQTTPKTFPKEISGYKGDVVVLAGGLNRWNREMMGKGTPGSSPGNPMLGAAFRQYFSGQKQKMTRTRRPAIRAIRRKGKKGGGCL